MIRVLLVDDMPDILEVLELMFNFHPDVEIVGKARNHDEALAVLNRKTVDIISIDIYMGSYNGFDLCRSVRRSMPQVFISMCSSEGSPANRRLARSLGAHFFIEKPITLEDVQNLLDTYRNLSVQNQNYTAKAENVY